MNIDKKTATLLISITFLLVLLVPTSPSAETQPESLFLEQFPAPEAKVFEAAIKGLENYRNSRQYNKEWEIKVDKAKGVLETNWFPEHRGEVKLKVQIVVWANHFRVDVWQKVGVMGTVKKTDWSRRTERHIQETIEKVLRDTKL